jgi:HemY protein
MRRALRILIPAVLAVAAALWLMANPGRMQVQAGDVTVEAPLWLGAVILVLLLGLVALVVKLYTGFRAAIWRGRVRRAERRRAEGDRSLVAALAALAAGDGYGAQRDVARARKRLGDTPLTLLVAGHAARAQGNPGAAKKAFGALADVGPPGAFLGHRGLAALAVEQGDKDEAAASARAALAMRPDAPWARSLVFDAAARAGDWRGALALAPKGDKGSDAAMRRAALLLGAATDEPDPKASLRMIEEAVELAPGLPAAHAARVAALEARGERRRAEAALERGIVSAAHPMLAALALAPRPRENATERSRRVEALAGYAKGPGAAKGEAELMAAQAAREAGLWAKARRHLALAREAGLGDRRVFLMLAEIATAEHGDTEAGRAEAELHLREAAAAAAEPAWWCGVCGARHEAWVPVCGECGSVASLRWGSAAAAVQRPPLMIASVPGL